MDQSGHTMLAEWTVEDPASVRAAQEAFAHQLEDGYFGVVSLGPGRAEHVHELPLDAAQVILRRPIAGG